MNTMREFFAVHKDGRRFLGQDIDGQGLSANKELANHHGLPIRVMIGDREVRLILPDWDSVDHIGWPDSYAMPDRAREWAKQQAAEYFAAHDQPCACSHCRDHRERTRRGAERIGSKL